MKLKDFNAFIFLNGIKVPSNMKTRLLLTSLGVDLPIQDGSYLTCFNNTWTSGSFHQLHEISKSAFSELCNFVLSDCNSSLKFLKPLQPVLVRQNGLSVWKLDFFSHLEDSDFPYRCISGSYRECLPYAENDEKLDMLSIDSPVVMSLEELLDTFVAQHLKVLATPEIVMYLEKLSIQVESNLHGEIIDLDHVRNMAYPGSKTNREIQDSYFLVELMKTYELETKANALYATSKSLKPFDPVLVRNDSTSPWRLEIFNKGTGDGQWDYSCSRDDYTYCIPYRGNEELLNTNKIK